MKKTILSLFLILCGGCQLFADFQVAKDGIPFAEIIVPAEEPEPVKNAAEELQLWTEKITGAKLPVLRNPGKLPNKIYLSCSRRILGQYPEEAAKLNGNDGYAVRQKSNCLYVFGSKAKGVLNGVYRLLFRNTDIIWARPNTEWTFYSRIPSLAFTETDYIDIPAFLVRGWQFNPPSEEEFMWATRNACNWTDWSISPGQVKRCQAWGHVLEAFGGHNVVGTYITESGYWKTHPEYFAYYEGKRLQPSTRIARSHLCYTNRNMIRDFIKEVDRIFPSRSGAICYGIRQEDGQLELCRCPECLADIILPGGRVVKKEDADFRSTQFFQFLNPIAEHVRKKWPDRLIQTYGYGFTEPPPAVPVMDNIEIQYCPIFKDVKHPLNSEKNSRSRDSLSGWLKKTNKIFVYEYYGLSGEYPRPCDVNTLEDMRYYLSKGITRIHSEIAKGDEKRKNIGAGKNIWDANGMYYWVMTQALWNPYQDVGTLRNEYLKRVYGPAADDMRRYFKEMEAAWNATDEPVLWNTDTQKSWNTFLKRGGLARCRQFLKQAEMKSLSPLGRKMLKRVAAGLNENPHVRLYEISEKLLSDYKANPKRYKNLAVNSGFEKRSDVYRKNHLDWTGSGVQNWGFWRAFKEGAYGPVEFEGRKESDCVYIHAPTTNACYLYDLPVKSGEVYLVSIYGRQENADDKMSLGIGWQNSGGWVYQNFFTFAFDQPQPDDWMLAEGVVVVPENVTKLVFMAGVPKGNKAKVFFDDAAIYKLK